MTKKANNYLVKILLFFLFLIFIEGFLCQQMVAQKEVKQIFSFLPLKVCNNYLFLSFWGENGLVENFQSILLFLSIIILLYYFIFLYSERNKFINTFLILHIIGLTYYLGEEISWGQHFFNWSTPEFFKLYNHQNETNIHNISNIFNQFPRTFVLIWCCFSIPVILIINRFSSITKQVFFLICPNKKLLTISIILIFFVLPDLTVDKLGLDPGGSKLMYLQKDPFLFSGYFYDLITFNFMKLSEFHELIFCYYFFLYATFSVENLKKRIDKSK